ncbi:hypothetical protein PVA19_15490 [Agrobacterium sp. CNPSo 3708]|uniref:hypothetical protein n=1 Tax=Agrobacterium sp. CNPSo 3708 TaxID=3028150 RepID=UPI002363D455|nr:hypothetical protein [Agrobacterium sp. CNPSo 3708]MDD1499825.1 hypothetical protein [Agrobacterium sp. CNPSo 3708]
MSFLPTTIIGRAIASVLVVLSLYGGFRLWLHSHDSAILKGYVLLSEKTAAQAKANEMERQRNAAAQALEDYRKRAVADALIQQQLETRLEQAIKDDNQNMDDGDYRWSDADRVWLCQQRGEAHCSR